MIARTERRLILLPDRDGALSDAEILEGSEALIGRLRASPGDVPWIALAAGLDLRSDLVQRIRDADAGVNIALLGNDPVSLEDLRAAAECRGSLRRLVGAFAIIEQVHRISSLIEMLLDLAREDAR